MDTNVNQYQKKEHYFYKINQENFWSFKSFLRTLHPNSIVVY